MQATVGTGRFHLDRMTWLALAVGIVASLIVTTIVATVIRVDSATGDTSQTAGLPAAPSEDYLYMEQNLSLPDGGEALPSLARRFSFTERERESLEGRSSAANPATDYLYQEMNLLLPGISWDSAIHPNAPLANR